MSSFAAFTQRNEQFCSFLGISHVSIVASNKQSKNDFHILIWWDHQGKLFTFLLEKTTRFMRLRAVSNKTGSPKYDHPIWLMREDFWGIPQTMAILSHPGSTQPLPKNRNENLPLQVPYVSTPRPPLYAPRFCKIALSTVWSLVFFVGQYPAVLSSEDNDQSYLSGSSGPSSKKASKHVC